MHFVIHRGEQGGAVADGGIHHLAEAGLLRFEQRGEHAGDQEHGATAHVADHVQRRGGRAVGVAHGVDHAGQRDVVEVMAGGRRQRTALAPAGHAAVDQLRIARQAHVRTEAETFHHAGAEAFDQHVGFVDQLQQDIGSARLLRVDGDAAAAAAELAAVAIEETGGHTVDADHFRTHVREDHGGDRRRADRVHFDNFHTCQGACHHLSLCH
ncbi:hypothetical protein D3C78_997940 [compost metagenome]